MRWSSLKGVGTFTYEWFCDIRWRMKLGEPWLHAMRLPGTHSDVRTQALLGDYPSVRVPHPKGPEPVHCSGCEPGDRPMRFKIGDIVMERDAWTMGSVTHVHTGAKFPYLVRLIRDCDIDAEAWYAEDELRFCIPSFIGPIAGE